jgi:hypothetical protein
MRYLMFIKSDEKFRNSAPPQALMDAMGEFIAETMASGRLVDTAGLKPSSEGTRLRLRGGQLTVADGPFTEAKEVIGGYAIVEAPSKAEAMAVATKFMELHRIHWPEFDCESEVRPFDDFEMPKS